MIPSTDISIPQRSNCLLDIFFLFGILLRNALVITVDVFFYKKHLYQSLFLNTIVDLHCVNIVISPNFLVWKICGKAQFPHSFGMICQKLCDNCAFLRNFHIRKLSEIAVFYAVLIAAIFI